MQFHSGLGILRFISEYKNNGRDDEMSIHLQCISSMLASKHTALATIIFGFFNRIQNKRFCLFIICVCTVYIYYVYI